MNIADTKVVSEFMRETPHPAVLAGGQDIDPADLTIGVVTVEEIERGLGRMSRANVAESCKKDGAGW